MGGRIQCSARFVDSLAESVGRLGLGPRSGQISIHLVKRAEDERRAESVTLKIGQQSG
jgi:hypothetical protein